MACSRSKLPSCLGYSKDIVADPADAAESSGDFANQIIMVEKCYGRAEKQSMQHLAHPKELREFVL